MFYQTSGARNKTAGAAVKGTELQAIKSELTQIKTNIEALLGRLEQITEETCITATDLIKAEECQSEEAWQEGEETSSELEDEEEQRQNSEAEEKEEEEGEQRQDDAYNHGENSSLSPETDPVHP
ncbi:hypothetical protein ILYODFUR_024608 [Ilyodon furcidens]|uniref:Uncharacterized protein n=1 Tax=Ilyodon furcidens TaxID=33524 RepID=A0ABV0SPB7_9TELE